MKVPAFKSLENNAMDYYWFDEGFTREELYRVSNQVESLPFVVASTQGGLTQDRVSNIKWIPQTNEWMWLYEKLMELASHANNEMWNFDIHTAPELIQYTEYYENNQGKYDWHQDIGRDDLSIRKISITVQLSDTYEYEGGDLCFWQGGSSLDKNVITAPRGAGNVVVFPSYMVHSVKPVTKGTRRSFVLWLGGGHYK